YGLPITESLAFSGRAGGSITGTSRVVLSSGSPMMPVCRVLGSESTDGLVCCSGIAVLFSGFAARRNYSLENVVVGPTPAQMAADRFLNIIQAGIRIMLHQRRATHHHSRSAETALHRVVFDEGLLDGVQPAILSK